jgi:disulfide bond formation protein DsbB
LLSGGLLIGAWIFQYGFGYAPCKMCYWQRHAHKLVVVIAVIALLAPVVNSDYPRLFTGLLSLIFLTSFGLAMWHVGVEYKWWEGPKSCSGIAPNFDTKDLLAALDKKIRPPACSEAVWHFLGLSMAAWNAIISLAGAALMLGLMRKGKASA